MQLIYDYTLKQLQDYFVSIKQKPFRAKQIFQWLYQKEVTSFSAMSDISKELQGQLEKTHCIDYLTMQEKQVSKDGTIKYLFVLPDGHTIETVLMRHEYGNSLCVTTQVGCNMKCAFCASGLFRKRRNLTAGEMVVQVMKVQQDVQERISHIVVMGTGEPFDNYDNVMQFVRIINEPFGLAIGARHITISTCGMVDSIYRYKDEGLQTNLAISLHGPNNTIRDALMPINKTYPMEVLRESLEAYIQTTNRRVTFEYILLKGVNDSIACARQLAHYCKGLNVYVNLIPYNPVDEHGLAASDNKAREAFKAELLRFSVNTTMRKEHGQDIDGACGQLRAKQSEVK